MHDRVLAETIPNARLLCDRLERKLPEAAELRPALEAVRKLLADCGFPSTSKDLSAASDDEREAGKEEKAGPEQDEVLQTSDNYGVENGRMPKAATAVRFADWAFGVAQEMASRAGPKWYVFKRFHDEWKQQKVLKTLPVGKATELLELLAKYGGLITKEQAFRLWKLPPKSLRNTLDVHLANLRNAIREAIGAHKKANPIVGDSEGWRAEVEIGFALQDSSTGEHGKQRMCFKTYAQLTDEERADVSL